MINKPIKRGKCITALSLDHRSDLLFCKRIKEGLAKNVDALRIRSYINFFWEHHLSEHFQEEEALLFNRLNDAFTRQGKQEHAMLTKRVMQLNYGTAENLQDFVFFAKLMIKHIRFEENVLFPHLEKELPVSMLDAV
ncbi:MAG: hemerythrin domain-containing protein, partial [Bacteroidetes bacterium]|nr:hemerythrin domain-containing protein [Bacteroidota bacterium]